MDRLKQFELSRRIVMDGLNRRKWERILEAYEADMIRGCNDNCAFAEVQRKMYDSVKWGNVRSAYMIKARAQAKARKKARLKDTALGCLSFFAYAVLLSWLTTWTHLPIWAASVYIALGALFLVLYVCRVHGLPKT